MPTFPPRRPDLDDSTWQSVTVDEGWSTGARVLRRQIEIPAKLNNYATRGASVKLDLTFDSGGPLVISVFSNGGLVYHGIDSTQQPRTITIYAGIPRIDVKMHAGWQEKHILLKVVFPLSAHSPKATYEIPYGTVERPTSRNTPAEQAQFEVPALQWADISDDSHDFSLLNDCKYGNEAKGNALRLSLLRSPEWPDAHADQGDHDFTYSLIPTPGPGARPKPSVAATN